MVQLALFLSVITATWPITPTLIPAPLVQPITPTMEVSPTLAPGFVAPEVPPGLTLADSTVAPPHGDWSWWWLLPLVAPIGLALRLARQPPRQRSAQGRMTAPTLPSSRAPLAPEPAPPVVQRLSPRPPPLVARQPTLLIGFGPPGMAVLQDVLASTRQQRSQSSDLVAGHDDDQLAHLVIASDDEDQVACTSDPAPELALVRLPSGAGLVQHSECHPRLACWPQTLQGRRSDRSDRKLALLENLARVSQAITARLGMLPEDTRDIWLVADGGEPTGCALLLDVAALIRMVLPERKLALHAILCLPDSTIHDPAHLVAAGALLRELGRSQLIYGQPPSGSPASPARFDPGLLDAPRPLPAVDTRLFDSCFLITRDRPIRPLLGVPLMDGLYPMIADMVRALTEAAAARQLAETNTDLLARLTSSQAQLETPLYSSIGCYTWELPVAAMIAWAADERVIPVLEALLGPAPLPATSLADFWEHLYEQSQQALFHPETYQAFTLSRPALCALLEPEETRGTIVAQAETGLVRWLHQHHEPHHRSSDLDTLLGQIETFRAQSIGTEHAPGAWQISLATNQQQAVAVWQTLLARFLTDLLNHSHRGALAAATTLLATITTDLARLLATLERHSADQCAQIQQQTAAQATRQRQPGHRWRWMPGIASAARERLIADAQAHYAADLELLATREAAQAVRAMQVTVAQLTSSLHAHRQALEDQLAAAYGRRDAARHQRRAQVEQTHVRHIWGMPHADLALLRDWLEQPALPHDPTERQHVQMLRRYIDGHHIAALIARQDCPPCDLAARIHWTWVASSDGHGVALAGCVFPGGDDPALALLDANALHQIAAASLGGLWDLHLADLWAEEFAAPDGSPASSLLRYLERVSGPAIQYRPTARDRHEAHTVLIAAPPACTATATFFADLAAAHQRTRPERSTFRAIQGGDPHRITLLHRLDLIGALDSGALPAYDQAWYHYQQAGAARVAHHTALQEMIAATLEVECGLQRMLGPALVDVLTDVCQFDRFARCLAHGLIRIAVTGAAGAYDHMIVWDQDGTRWPLAAADQGAAWVQALRVWMADIPPPLIDAALQDCAARQASDYPAFLHAPDGLLATLRQSPHGAERDLADLLAARLEWLVRTCLEPTAS